MATRFFMPPERSLGICLSLSLRPTSFELFGDNARDFLRRLEPMFGEVKTDVFADGQRIEQRAGLEDHGHAVLAHDFGGLDGLALDEDFPRIRLLPGR